MSTRKVATASRSSRPRYVEIADLLAAEISQGRRSVGTLLPTEHELSAAHQVSRATVREALRQLQGRGLIARSQGVGTRVLASSARANYLLSSHSVTLASGYSEESHFVAKQRRVIRASPALARQIGVTPGSEWVHLSGYRVLMRQLRPPLSIVNIYVASQYAEFADTFDGVHPIFQTIERERGVAISEITQDINALILTASQARQLRTDPGSAGLHVLRRFLGPEGQPVEVTRNLHVADRFTFSLRLHPSQSAVPPPIPGDNRAEVRHP
jgi:DNA-binding GntR family transcriptional regulator